MWPQTVGWIWLGLALAVALTYLLARWLKVRRNNAYRRAALQALLDRGDDPIEIANILRQAALAGFEREKVASLTGDSWLNFLDKTCEEHLFLGTPAGRNLLNAPYQKSVAASDLASCARVWVTKHRPLQDEAT